LESKPKQLAQGERRPVRGQISLLKALDLSRFEPTPRGELPPMGRHVSGKVSAKIKAQADRVAERLHARKEILDELSRAAVDSSVITGLVSGDAALAAQILKTINSPYYGLRQPSGSIGQAVHLLGSVEIRNIVWRTCISESISATNRAAGELLGGIWRHAFSTSRVAHAMARSFNLPRAKDISVAALLHDVGKFICLNVWPGWTQTFFQPLRFSNHQRLSEEKEHLGMGHAMLGAEVARAWGLPSEICTTIEQHHAPSYLPPPRVTGNRRAIAVVHLSDVLCHIADPYLGGREISPVQLPVSGWMAVLGVRDNLESVCSESVILALLPPTVDRNEVASNAA